MIGIFQEKEPHYNLMILKTLLEKGPLKPWDIAKSNSSKMDRTQDIHGNLIRNNGKLSKLCAKGYTTHHKDGTYAPTFKGILAILVHEKYTPKISQVYKNALSGMKFPAKVKIPFMDVEVPGKKYEEVYSEFAENLSGEQEYVKLKRIVEELLESGLNLDVVSDSGLLGLVLIKILGNSGSQRQKEKGT